MKYLQGKGYRVIPVNPGIAGQSLLGEKVYASLRDIPGAASTWSTCSAPRAEAPAIVEDAIAIGAQGGVDAARHPQRRGRRDGRGGRARGRHEPLPEDRVRPARRRIVVERRQQRHHPEPRAAGAAGRAAPASDDGARALAQPELRLRDLRGPCRRRARPGDRRALDADLPDDLLRLRRCRPRRLALQPAQFRLHLFAPDQPDRRRSSKSASPASKAAAPRSPRPRAMRRSS